MRWSYNRVQLEEEGTAQYLDGGWNVDGKLQAVRAQHCPFNWPAQVLYIEWNKLEVVAKSSYAKEYVHLGQADPNIGEMSAGEKGTSTSAGTRKGASGIWYGFNRASKV